MNANELELNCSGTSLSIIQWLEALELEFFPMAQHLAWVIVGLGAFPPCLLFPSPKNLKHYKALTFLSILFSRRKWPEVRIAFLENPFCCTSHLYLWDICPGHKIDIQECFVQEIPLCLPAHSLWDLGAFTPPSWSLLLYSRWRTQISYRVRNQPDYNSSSLKHVTERLPIASLWLFFPECCVKF